MEGECDAEMQYAAERMRNERTKVNVSNFVNQFFSPKTVLIKLYLIGTHFYFKAILNHSIFLRWPMPKKYSVSLYMYKPWRHTLFTCMFFFFSIVLFSDPQHTTVATAERSWGAGFKRLRRRCPLRTPGPSRTWPACCLRWWPSLQRSPISLR